MIVRLTFPEDVKQKLLRNCGITPNGKRYINHRGIIFEYIGLSRLNGDVILKTWSIIFEHINSRREYFKIIDIVIIPELDESQLFHKKPESKRVFNDVDPYGEEDWNN